METVKATGFARAPLGWGLAVIHAERVIMSIGAPFVPINQEGMIYIRAPVS